MYDARPAANVMIGAGTAKDLSSTGVFAYTWNFLEPAEIRQLAVKVTVVLVATAGAVITFRRRPAYGSAGSGATAQTSLGTVTVGINAAVDTVWVNNITPVIINPGDQIVCDCTTAASASGSAIAYLVHCFDPEVSKNEGKVTVVTA